MPRPKPARERSDFTTAAELLTALHFLKYLR
jgi:hypothetical protein